MIGMNGKCPGAAILAVIIGSSAAFAGGAAIFSKPGLVTSVGQSSDISVIKALLNTKMKMGFDVKPVAQAEDLGGIKSLILVVGASTKGLGAAGLNMDQEIARSKALLKAARDKGVKILVMHTGGESRRGKTSNDLIELAMPEADHAVVVASGNKDKIFNALAAKRGITVAEVGTLAEAGEAVKAVFKE